MKQKPFYITTPIYYVTDIPHIGHLYSTVAADIIARYQRLLGNDVWFLTGTDEHGQKIQKKAKENGETPQALADRVVERYKEAWKVYDITFDDFIRTTEERHKVVVQEYISRLMETGDIYLSDYEGWYCVPDEAYWTETQIVDGKCPDCGRPVEKLKEESYFFRMSKFGERLLKHIEDNPSFIFPESRKNEVTSFIKSGLRDISVSRTTIQWGIPMPAPKGASPGPTREHKIYVWFDALTNYISALNPPLKAGVKAEENSKFAKYWPEAIHLVGKDILKFHAVYWPTFLMALDLPLPRRIVAHGWLTDANRKISKSLGNVIDPIALSKEVGVDGMRYFLFREFAFGLDGEYTKEVVYQRINSDLANDYGNCVNRLCAMTQKYLGDGAVSVSQSLGLNSDVKTAALEAVPLFHSELTHFAYQRALEQVWKIIGSVNRYIETSAPWTLAKSKDQKDVDQLRHVLIHCHEALRVSSLLLLPFLPNAAPKALEFLGDTSSQSLASPMDAAQWGKGPKEVRISRATPLFPRLELPGATPGEAKKK